MQKKQVMLLALLALLAGLVLWLANRTRQPPLLPADPDHARFDGAAACMTCHGPDGPLPQDPNHPLGQDCMRCHGTARR
jgi:cytochrome c553